MQQEAAAAALGRWTYSWMHSEKLHAQNKPAFVQGWHPANLKTLQQAKEKCLMNLKIGMQKGKENSKATWHADKFLVQKAKLGEC